MTDHEIHLALARLMGWREIPSTDRSTADFYQEIGEAMLAGGTAFFLLDGGSTICPVGRGRNDAPWAPTINPAQAVEVMAEAARVGWEVEARMTGRSAWARVASRLRAHSVNEPGGGAATWCRAVCLAILESQKPFLPGETP